MYCTGCGQELAGEARFCLKCGRETSGQGQSADSGRYDAPKKLFRLVYDKKIAGVCAGLSRLLNLDVTLVRILTVAVTAFTGFLPGIIAYIFAWIIMPVEEAPRRPSSMQQHAESART